MERSNYVSDDILSLSEYVDSIDDIDMYHCWQDNETQKGYNHKTTETFEEFCNGSIESLFIAIIIRKTDAARIGAIFVSPENTLPDLAIMIYPQFRRHGYATRAFSLGVVYCLDTLKIEHLYAGCYPYNAASLKMLVRCGFKPHPQGNQNEQHFLTGENIVQLDFVIHKAKNVF